MAPVLSRRLMQTYGSLVGVLADPEGKALKTELPDAVRERLQYLGSMLGSAWQHEVQSAPVFANSQTLIRYLHFGMAALKREHFRVLFLDAANRLLLDEVMWQGSVNRVQVHPREVVRLALETQASALILAHNHPAGQSGPSAHDIQLTQQIIAACNLLDIIVHDHLIVTRQDVFSMRREHSLMFAPKR
ncbi:MAG: DNA repair protein RadC [Sphingorhabdus sp.]